MKKIIIGLFIISVYVLGNQLQWDCTEKVFELNYQIEEAKKLPSPKKIDKLRNLLNTIYEVSGECKSTDVNKDFAYNGSNNLGTDNLKIVIKMIIEGKDSAANKIQKETDSTLERERREASIIVEGKYISYNYNTKRGTFEIGGYKTELTIASPGRLNNHKNEILKIKYNPDYAVLFDIYFNDGTSLKGINTTNTDAINLVQKNNENNMVRNGNKVTVRGIIFAGLLDSSIRFKDGSGGIGFSSESKVGDKIFSICKMDDYCEVIGVINNDFFISVSNVKKITDNNINNSLNPNTLDTVFSSDINSNILKCSDYSAKKLVKEITAQEIARANLMKATIPKHRYMWNDFKAKHEQIEKIIDSYDLKVISIRTDSIDEKVKKTTCKAQVKSGNGHIVDITYTVQKTSDGQLFVEVFGL